MARPSPAPPVARDRGRVGPVEPLEHVLGGPRIQSGTVVTNGDDGPITIRPELDVRSRAARGVCANVAEEVVDDLAEAGRVAAHRHDVGDAEVGRVIGRDRPGRPDRFDDERSQIDRSLLERPSFVQPDEQQQFLDELVHAARLGGDAVDRPIEIVGMLAGTALDQLGVRAHRRDGSAQLVGDIGDEAAHALLGVAKGGLGGVTLGKRLADPVEHGVQRGGDPPDLGGCIGSRRPEVERSGSGDGQRGLFNPSQRPQPGTNQQPTRRDGDGQGGRGDDDLDDEKSMARVDDLMQGLADHQRAAVSHRGDPHPHAVPAPGDCHGAEFDDVVGIPGDVARSGPRADQSVEFSRRRLASRLTGGDHEAGTAGGVDERDERAGRRLLDRRLDLGVIAGDLLLDRLVGLLQSVVDLAQLRSRERGVRRHAGQRQRHERDHGDGDHQADTQRHLVVALGLTENVADEPNRVEKGRAEAVEFLADIADVRLEDVRVAIEVVVPDVIEDLAFGEHADAGCA